MAPSVQIVSDAAGLRDLREEWDAAWLRLDARWQDSWEHAWLSWVHVEQPAGATPAIAVVRGAEGIELLLPLAVERVGPLRHLRPLGPHAADETCWVARGGPQAAAEPILDAWDAVVRAIRPDFTTFPILLADEPVHRALSARRTTIGLNREPLAVARLSEEESWESFAPKLGELSGRKPGRVLRRLQKQGVVEHQCLLPGDPESDAIITWLFAQKRIWSERSGKSGDWLRAASYENFVQGCLRPPAERGRLMVTRLDGRVVAVIVIGVGTTSVTGIVSAFDQDVPGNLRVGAACWEWSMRWALEHGLDFDTTVGHEVFKRYYALGRTVPAQTVRVPHSVKGFAASQANRLHRARQLRRDRA